MNSNEGWTLCSTPLPMTPNATTTTAQATSTGMAWRIAKRATGVINASVLRIRCVPGQGHQHSPLSMGAQKDGRASLTVTRDCGYQNKVTSGRATTGLRSPGKDSPRLTLSHETVVALLDGLELF